MRIMVEVRPQFPIPPEQIPALIEGFAAWRERHRAKMEVFEFFAGSAGGMGIVNVADEAELNQLMMEWPFAPFSHVECRPVIQGDAALAQWQAALQAMAGAGHD
jgi:hypothetical protein